MKRFRANILIGRARMYDAKFRFSINSTKSFLFFTSLDISFAIIVHAKLMAPNFSITLRAIGTTFRAQSVILKRKTWSI